MSNLSEEEIIEQCNNLIATLPNLHVNGETIQGLLDLYDKEKEDNQTLRRQLNSAFDRGFIHKDKIREVRDKLEVADYYGINEAVDDLNKLLEEKNEHKFRRCKKASNRLYRNG